MGKVRRNPHRWAVPREWEGETAFILGGGPSLGNVDVSALRGRGRVIAINDAGFTKAPWADVHYAADRVWYKWPHNQKRLGLFQGKYRATRQLPPPLPAAYDIKVLGWDAGRSLSRNPTMLCGRCGGANSINLAFLFGARRIILLGFDMRPGSWHSDHKRRIESESYKGEYIPALARMAVELTKEGVRVLNATPGSALPCFPILPLQEALMETDEAPATEVEAPLAKRVIEALKLKRGATVIEFGAFDPHLTRALKKAGMKMATVAPDEGGGRTPGVEHTRSDLSRIPPKLAPAAYGVCETLAERVPAARAEEAIRAIASKVEKGCYFSIGTRTAHGPRTVKRNGAWWLGKLGLAFPSVVMLAERDGQIEVVCRHD